MTPEIAISIALSGWPPRYCEIDRIEAWYWGHQYTVDGPWQRKHPWAAETDRAGKYIPLADRAPYDMGIAKALVDQTTGFLFDEGRFPQLLVDGDDAGAVAGQAWLRAIADHCNLRVRMLEAARIGGRCRSVFVYFKVVDGEPIIDCHSGKACEPTFGRDGKTLVSVRKQYKAPGEAFLRLGYQGLDPAKLYWFRHDFTEAAELRYFPVEVEQGPKVPVFVVDEARSFRHDLGFVAGQWMVNLMRAEDSTDGIGTYEGDQVLGLIHLCNEVMSQAHRATKHALDPQWALEVDPEKEVDTAAIRNQTKGGVWVMPGKLSLVEAAGTGQAAAHEQFDRYRALISDTTSIPEVDPEAISGKAQSAEALRVLFQGLIAFASLLRVSYGDDGLVPFAKVILRVLKATAAGTLNVDAFDDKGTTIGRGALPDRPRVRLEWGPWFAPTAADEQAKIGSAAAAVGSGLLSQETAVSFIARLYGRDGAEELKLILAERKAHEDEAMRSQVDLEAALAKVGSEADVGEDDDEE